MPVARNPNTSSFGHIKHPEFEWQKTPFFSLKTGPVFWPFLTTGPFKILTEVRYSDDDYTWLPPPASAVDSSAPSPLSASSCSFNSCSSLIPLSYTWKCYTKHYTGAAWSSDEHIMKTKLWRVGIYILEVWFSNGPKPLDYWMVWFSDGFIVSNGIRNIWKPDKFGFWMAQSCVIPDKGIFPKL